MSLRRYTVRAMQQRPGRTILTMLSIVIGVTAAVAVGLGTATTRNAYKQMFAMVTGRASLEVEGKGGKSFSEDILPQVAEVPGVKTVTPLVSRPTSMSLGEDRRLRIQLLGIDPARDQEVRDYDFVAGRQVKEGDELVLEKQFADYLDLKVGDQVRVLTPNARSKSFEIVGLFAPKTAASFTQLSMAFVPIDRAQRYFNGRYVPKNAIDKIQIVTASNVTADDMQKRIAPLLPEETEVHKPAASTQLMREVLLASEQGLTLTTYFSLLMAAIIIVNTFFMNVTERRRHLSIMRAIGATKRQIAMSLLAEGLLLGVVGTAIGIALGVLTAFVVTYVLATSFQVQLPRLVEVMTPKPFVVGTVFGLGMALIGTALPALVASRVSPLEGMNRSPAGRSRASTRWFFIVGSLLTLGSALIIYGSIAGWLPMDMATFAALTLLIGLVLLDAVILGPQATFVSWLLKPLGRVESALALKQVLRHHTRSALTVAVLFIVGSTGVGMANSILDNVKDVYDWFDQAIMGDYFIRAMMPDLATGTAADLPEELGEELEKFKESKRVTTVEGASFVEAKVPVRGGDAITAIVVAREYQDPQKPAFDLIAGDPVQLRDQIRSGKVVVGSVLAQKLGLKLGDRLPIETTEGVQEVPVCGIANEYLVGGLAVHMFREQAAKWLGVQGVDGYVIKATDAHRDAIKPELEALAKKYDVILLSRVDIRRNIDGIVSGAAWSLWALVYIGFIVAAFGVVNTLTMNVLEQTRELGLLRIVAMTKKQVWRTIIKQAMIIGGVGLPPGIAVGVVIAYVLNLAMMPSFGHPVDFHIHQWMVLGTLLGALLIVLVAAIIPARRATQVDVVEALHYE